MKFDDFMFLLLIGLKKIREIFIFDNWIYVNMKENLVDEILCGLIFMSLFKIFFGLLDYFFCGSEDYLINVRKEVILIFF